MTRKIVFHIGLAKTGTTAFQRFCQQNRRLLKRHGVLYPKRQLGRAKNHSPLVASYLAHRPESPSVAVRWVPRADAVRALTDEITASDADIALVSSEHFSTHFVQYDAEQLAEDFAGFELSVVLVLRDPHARFFSLYNTHVTAGGCLPLEDYAKNMLVPGARFMSIEETVLIWQRAFGAERLRLVDYDAEPDLTAAILRQCGVAAALPPTARDRVSLDVGTVRALRDVNAALHARQATPADRSLFAYLAHAIFSYLCRRRLLAMPRDPVQGWSVSSTTMAALDVVAARDRAFVAEHYGLALRGSSMRDKVRVAEPGLDFGEEGRRRADALIDKVAGGAWKPVERTVAFLDRRLSKRMRAKGWSG